MGWGVVLSWGWTDQGDNQSTQREVDRELD